MKGDLYARVRSVRPVARKMLEEGLDDSRCEWSDSIPCDEPKGLTDEQVAQLVRWSQAVYAVGIAVGLMLQPDVFKTGGAK